MKKLIQFIVVCSTVSLIFLFISKGEASSFIWGIIISLGLWLYNYFDVFESKIEDVREKQNSLSYLEYNSTSIEFKNEKLKENMQELESDKKMLHNEYVSIANNIKDLQKKKKGFNFEKEFEIIASQKKLILQYIDQDFESMEKYRSILDEDIKRPDFFILNIEEKIFLELKRNSSHFDGNMDKYFLFSYREMKGLERFQKAVFGKEIYILFLDQKDQIKAENIYAISLTKMIRLVYEGTFEVIKKNNIRVLHKHLTLFNEINRDMFQKEAYTSEIKTDECLYR